MISIYSFATSILLFNFALVIVYLLRKRKLFLVKYGTQTLMLLTILGIVRLFSPIDFKLAYVARSYTVIPTVQSALNTVPFNDMPRITVGNMILITWFLGICAFFIKDCTVLYLDYQRRRRYKPQEDERIEAVVQELEIKHPVIISRRVPTPHVAGFIRPKIYLPPLELMEDEWKYVLKHEGQHIKSRDTAIKLFYFIHRSDILVESGFPFVHA